MTAGVTYTPISSYTVSGSSTTTITFSSIAQTYTDLRLVIVGGDASNNGAYIRFNSASGAYYSSTYLQGNGTSAASGRQSNQTSVYSLGYYEATPSSVTELVTWDIFNYANTTTFKTWLMRNSQSTSSPYGATAAVGLWRGSSGSAEAINRIDIYDSANFASGTTATLYGVKSA